jgi:hypothetical protein
VTVVSYHGAEWDATVEYPFGPVRSTFEEAERPYIEQLFAPGDRTIVSGVGFGYTLAALAVRCGRENVVGIEAQRDLAGYTKINILVDGHELDVRWQAITPLGEPAVLGPARVWACVAAHPAAPPRGPHEAVRVPGVRLADLHAEGYDCLMLDIEGGEWALVDQLGLFRKVLIEVHAGYTSPRTTAFLEALLDHGFIVRGSDCTYHDDEPVSLVAGWRQ